MSKAPQRAPVPMMQAQKLQRTASGDDNFAPIRRVEVSQSRASQVLGVLNDVLPGVASGATNEIQRIVNDDKLRQQNRALMNLTPTEDATKAGVKAHEAVGYRNQAAEAVRELQAQAASFEGTDEEWEDQVASAQDRLLQQLGDDRNVIDAVGGIFREGLPRVADVRFKATQQQDQMKKYRTAISSYANAADPSFSPEQVRQNLIQVEAENQAMGMTKEATRKALIDATIIGAKNKDLTLMNWVKSETDWFDQEPSLIAANKQAIAEMEQDQQGEIALAKQSLLDQLKNSPTMSFKQFVGYASSQTTAEGKPTWSESEMRSAWNSAQKKLDSAFAVDDFFSTSLRRLSDETVDPVGFSLTDKQEREVIKKFDEYQAKELIAINNEYPNPDEKGKVLEAVAQQRNQKAKWLQENSMTDKKWVEEFKSLQAFDGESMEGDALPRQISNVLGKMNDLQGSPAALANHADDKSIGIFTNFQRNKQAGMNDVQAYQTAYKQAMSPPVRMSGNEAKKFNKNVSRAVDSEYDSGILAKMFGAPDDIQDTQRRELSALIGARAKSLMAANVDEETAIAQATSEVKETHTQLSNGQVVYGTRQQLGQRLGVSADQVDGVLTSLATRVSEEGLANTDTPPEDWVMVVALDKQGGLVRFKDKLGSYVTRPITLNEIGGMSNSERAKKLAEQANELRQRRIKVNESLKQARQGGYSFEDPLGRF